MIDWLSERADTHADHPFLVLADEQHITFAEMNRQVAKRAYQLAKQGVEAGDFIGLHIHDQLAFVKNALAVLRLNATIVPLNLRLTKTELEWQVENAGCKLVLVDSDVLDDVSVAVVDVNTLADVSDDSDVTPYYKGEYQPDSAFAVIHTSGTSGQPKGALLTFDNIRYSAEASKARLGVFADDCWLCILPLYHIGGLSIIMRSIMYGTRVMLYPRFDVGAINDRLTNYPITLVSLVPTMLRRLIDAREGAWNDSLRLVLLGGAAPSQELVSTCIALNIPVATTYGLSEASSQVATTLSAENHPKAEKCR